MPPKRVRIGADRCDGGIDLNSVYQTKPGMISGGRSARFERGKGIFTGTGHKSMKNFGTVASTYLFEGTVFPLLWAKSATKVYQTADPTSTNYYDIGLTQTSAEASGFVQQGNGDIFVINQTDAPVRIAVAQNTVAIADTDTEITVGADWIGKFAASGTIYIRGDSIAYTGVNATQLTGVTGIATGGHPVSSYITQTTTPSTMASQKGTWGFSFDNQMIVGGRLHYENVLYASAPEDSINPAYFYDFNANGTVTKVLTNKMVGGIKTLNGAYLLGERQVFYMTGFNLQTGGFEMKPMSDKYGAYNPRCIVDMDGTIVFLGRKRLIAITTSVTIQGSLPTFDEAFDHAIRPWLDALDTDTSQTGACLGYDSANKLLKITASRNGALETYVYDAQNGVFLPQETRIASSYAMFGSIPYFGSTQGKVHRDEFGRTNDGIAINHSWQTGRMELEKGRAYMQLYKLEYNGWMSQASEHTLNVYINGSSTASYSVSFTDSLITTQAGTAVGNRGVGVSTIGGDANPVYLYPYKNTVLLRGLSGEDVNLEWVCSKEGAYFQTDSYEIVADLTRMNQRTFS